MVKYFLFVKAIVSLNFFVIFSGIPVLVLGNKRDLPGSLDEKELIERL